MPIDIAMLATTVVSSFLLPYVKDGAKKVAEALTEKGSKAAADYIPEVAKKVWDRVTSVFSSDTDKATLTQFEKYPEQAKPLVETILTEKLQRDDKLVQELDQLVNTAGPDGNSASVQIKDVVGDVGVLYMSHADFRQAQNVRLAGVMKEYKTGGSEGPQPAAPPDPAKE
jgi:hypothetical protein